jgi:hypothetical protein
MMTIVTSSTHSPRRMPWNKGKLIGAKPPLRLMHVWAIRSTLQLSSRIRDLALFNLGIDTPARRWTPISEQRAGTLPDICSQAVAGRSRI